MRKYLFEKANWFIINHKVKILSETEYSMRVGVGKYEAVVKYQNHKFIWLCNCKHGSTNKTCSHILAAMTYLTLKKCL